MASFESFYLTWYSRAKIFACEFVMDEADAENIVQDVFVRLYERSELFDMPINLTAYLFTSIRNACLNYLKKQMMEREVFANIQNEFEFNLRMNYESLEAFNTDFPDEESIKERLHQALDTLPEKCRRIFIMSKLEGKKQSQIAEELQISVKTIENQMTIAYKRLRQELKDCMPLFIFLFAVS